jgi:hypothetical protein
MAEEYMGWCYIASCIRNLPLGRGMLSALYVGRLPLTSAEVSTGTRWIEGRVNPEVGLDNFDQSEIPTFTKNRKILFSVCPYPRLVRYLSSSTLKVMSFLFTKTTGKI